MSDSLINKLLLRNLPGRMKNILVIAFTIAFGFAHQLKSQSLKDLSFGTDSTLEVVTWNIEWFPKNGNVTADSVSKILVALDADVYALQEIGDSTAFNKMISKVDGYHARFDRVRHGGLAYVYKSSLTGLKFYNVFGSQDYRRPFPRAPFVMEFTFDDKKYYLINNHWKCCGNGLLEADEWDEEQRRKDANDLLKQYIDRNWANGRVMLLGDLNDILTDKPNHNVFTSFLDDNANYQFADLEIAKGPISNWSYPGWPSHLDHILISNELLKSFENPEAIIQTLPIEDNLSGGFSEYDRNISDHRPVAIKLPIESIPIGRGPSIGELAEMQLSFPTQHFMEVSYHGQADALSVVNADGKLMHSEPWVSKTKTTQLNTQQWESGVYIVRLTRNNVNVATKKVVIN